MSDENKTKTTVSLLGILPTVFAWVLLASIGACGDSCQSCTQDGIKSTIKAFRGEP